MGNLLLEREAASLRMQIDRVPSMGVCLLYRVVTRVWLSAIGS